jgi:hypothetical protein
MRDLYAWGELISRGFQSDDLEENITDWGSGMGSLSSCIGTDVWEKIGEAASNLCEYLGSDEALLACEEVLNELKELKEKVDGGGNPEGFGCIL